MKEELTCSLIQADLHWENIEANLSMFSDLIDQAHDTDLIVLPEMFSTGFSMNASQLAETMDGPTIHWLKEMAQNKNTRVCGSCIIKESGHYYNRFVWAEPDGHLSIYDKKHLFTLAGEDQYYSPGKERLIMNIEGWRIMPLICYDLRFPVWSRSRKSKESVYEYDALLYVANWPAPRANAWETLLRARAIENQSYCLGLNRVGKDGKGLEYLGQSGLIDFSGQGHLHQKTEKILTAKLSAQALQSFREKLPFQADADSFELT